STPNVGSTDWTAAMKAWQKRVGSASLRSAHNQATEPSSDRRAHSARTEDFPAPAGPTTIVSVWASLRTSFSTRVVRGTSVERIRGARNFVSENTGGRLPVGSTRFPDTPIEAKPKRGSAGIDERNVGMPPRSVSRTTSARSMYSDISMIEQFDQRRSVIRGGG